MSKSVHQLEIRGVNKTSGAFSAIRASANATGAQIRSMVSGAIAAGGAFLGFKAIASGIRELGNLSDMAANCATSTDDLTRAMTAMQIVGVKTDLSTLTRTFAKLQKETGDVGMDGFTKQLKRIAAIEDPALRAQEAMKTLGRSGADFLKIVNGGAETVDALERVANAMPRIPQAAADAGDEVSDAMDIASAGVKSVWLQAIGAVSRWFGEHFAGGIREAAAKSANYLEYYAKVGTVKALSYWRRLTTFSEAIGTFWGTFFASDKGFSEAIDDAMQAYNDEMRSRDFHLQLDDEENNKRIAAWDEIFEKRNKEIEQLQENYNKVGARAGLAIGEGADKLEKAAKSIRNDLVMGGTNAVRRLEVLGPNLQAESKQQTELLKMIAENTAKTADNTDGAADNLEVIY